MRVDTRVKAHTTEEMGPVKRVLIVEDEEDVAELVADVLALEGYETRISIGEHAIRDMKEFRPEVILLDLMMPGVDGFEVRRRMQAEDDLGKMPVVVMTAMHDPEARAREAGTPYYLAKPFDIGDLLRVIVQVKL